MVAFVLDPPRKEPTLVSRTPRRDRTVTPIGQFMTDRLERVGKTQADLRRYTDFSPTALTSWKYGDKIPAEESVWRMTEAFAEMEGYKGDNAHIEALYRSMMKLTGRVDHLLSVADLSGIPAELLGNPKFNELLAELQSVADDDPLLDRVLELCLQQISNFRNFIGQRN